MMYVPEFSSLFLSKVTDLKECNLISKFVTCRYHIDIEYIFFFVGFFYEILKISDSKFSNWTLAESLVRDIFTSGDD